MALHYGLGSVEEGFAIGVTIRARITVRVEVRVSVISRVVMTLVSIFPVPCRRFLLALRVHIS